MPSLHKRARQRSAGDDPPAPVGRVRVADLKPLPGVTEFARIVRMAVPADVPEGNAGAHPRSDRVVVSGSWVLYGWEWVQAAKEAAADTVEAEQCAGCDGLHAGDLLLKAAGLHYRAVLHRLREVPFNARRIAVTLYAAWLRNFERRRPRKTPPAKKAERKALRKLLIKQELELSDRVVQREARLLRSRPKLLDAARRGLLSQRDFEKVAGLPAYQQDRVAERLVAGEPFVTQAEELFGPGVGRKKTVRAAARAIRAAVHTIASEARGREGQFALKAEDHPAAQEAEAFLSRLLAGGPVPEVNEALNEEIGDLMRDRAAGASAADHGGRGGRA